MKLLCDNNVDKKYIDTVRRTEWLTIATVREELSADADDPDISEYAERHGWVVFTEDDDYLGFDHDRGLVLYIGSQHPPPDAVVAGIGAIADAYDEYRTIEEYVPNGWV